MNKDKLIANMNEDQIINYIQEKNYAGVRLSPGEKHLIGKTVERVKGIIQSEPEETKPIDIEGVKTIFHDIIETPEKLADFITDACEKLTGTYNKKFCKEVEFDYQKCQEDMVKHLNEKAGE